MTKFKTYKLWCQKDRRDVIIQTCLACKFHGAVGDAGIVCEWRKTA